MPQHKHTVKPTNLNLFIDDPDIIKRGSELALLVAIGLCKYNQGSLHLARYAGAPHIKQPYDELFTLYDQAITKTSVKELLNMVPDLNLVIPVSNADRARLISGMIALDAGSARPGIDFYSEHNDTLELPYQFDQDRYGLITIDEQYRLENQGIIFNDTLIFYHPFLRRFFNARFVDTPAILRHLQQSKSVTLKLALDPILHATPNMLDQTVEFDYWYGQYFDTTSLNDRNFSGVTVHGRNDTNGVLDFTFPLIKTVTYVSNYSNNEKEFQIEEIVPTDSRKSSGHDYVLHRFAHFIWNQENQTFRHLDCSVLIYTKEQHAKRIKYDWKQKDSERYASTYKRKKLFRLDGEMELKVVKDLLFSFFRYNELVMEYFSTLPEGLNNE